MPAAISMHGIKVLMKCMLQGHKEVINNSKMVETKILNCTKNLKLTEKEKRTQTRKLKRFLTKSKGCRAEEICHWSTM